MNDLNQLIRHCESEKLGFSGAIQSFGALLKISDTGIIIHVSANIEAYLHQSPDILLGASYHDLTSLEKSIDEILSVQLTGKTVYIQVSVAQHKCLDVGLIRTEDGVLVEIELVTEQRLPNEIRTIQHQLLRPPRNEAEIQFYHQALLRGLHKITGLDRLMVYRFHEDWSGEVIAEEAESNLGSYCGLRFPASDIPANARQLYLLNPIRSIPDRTASNVPIIGIDERSIDLSRTDLRSVSPMHIQYLQNMGVAASYSLPVVLHNKLWGLIAGHHLKPLFLDRNQRLQCISLLANYNLGLANYFCAQNLRSLDNMERYTKAFLSLLFSGSNPLDNIERHTSQILQAIDADGFAMLLGREIITIGTTPEFADLATINDWFSLQKNNTCTSRHLLEWFPEHPLLLASVSGMLAIKIESTRYGSIRLYWFRCEEKQQIIWAGNPNKPVAEKTDTMILSPRRSFEKWIENLSGYSRPWSDSEKLFVTKLRSLLYHL